jgi:hypothetical protein
MEETVVRAYVIRFLAKRHITPAVAAANSPERVVQLE